MLGVAADWTDALEEAVRDAQAEGLVDPDVGPAQLAFQLNAYALLGNGQFVASGSKEPLDRARGAIAERLDAVRVAGSAGT